MPDNTPPVFVYDVREIAAGAKVSVAHVWSEIRAGELETCLVGDRRLATPAQIEAWLLRKAARAKRKREERAQREQEERRP
jgi:hypothetical protein